MGRCRWDRLGPTGSVGHRGPQQVLLLTGHRDLQSPPHGERGEVQQQQLGAASQAPDKFHTLDLIAAATCKTPGREAGCSDHTGHFMETY